MLKIISVERKKINEQHQTDKTEGGKNVEVINVR